MQIAMSEQRDTALLDMFYVIQTQNKKRGAQVDEKSHQTEYVRASFMKNTCIYV